MQETNEVSTFTILLRGSYAANDAGTVPSARAFSTVSVEIKASSENGDDPPCNIRRFDEYLTIDGSVVVGHVKSGSMILNALNVGV